MTPKLTRIVALFRPCRKTDARCGWLPAARAARTMVEQLIWLFSSSGNRGKARNELNISASLIGHSGSSLRCRCRSRARVSLRNRPQGPSIKRFEDGVEQSLPRPYRQSDGRVQADMRSHLIYRPARDIIPPLGGARVSSYRIWSCAVFMLLPRLVPGPSGTRCRQPRCGA